MKKLLTVILCLAWFSGYAVLISTNNFVPPTLFPGNNPVWVDSTRLWPAITGTNPPFVGTLTVSNIVFVQGTNTSNGLVPNLLDTNYVAAPPVDGYLLSTVGGIPTFTPPGSAVVVQTNFIAYTTNFYINNNIVSNYFYTNVFTVTQISNYFATFYNFVTTNVTVTNTFITNYLTQSTTVVSNLTLQMISTNNYVSNYFQTNIFNSITQVITNSDLWWVLNPLTGAITNVNGGGVSVGPGTNGASQVYLLDASGTFVIGGFDTNAHAGFFGPGIAWSNNSNFIWPAGQPAPDPNQTLPGPSEFFTGNGSLFSGTNVTKDINPLAPNSLQIYQVAMANSNEPTSGVWYGASIDSENYNFYSYWNFTRSANKDSGNINWDVETQGTNGVNHRFNLVLSPSGTTKLSLATNGVDVFKADSNGLVTASGYIDKGGPADSVSVAVSGPSGRLLYQLLGTNTTVINTIITNVTFNTFFNTNIFTNLFTTNLYSSNLFSTNITVQTINSQTNIFNLSKGSTLILTNGFSPGFQTLNTPNSQGTNWILDASQASYFTILATNAINVQYVTNTLPAGHGITGAAVSLRILPNGANRQFSVNTNFVLLQTNLWTLNTSVNPGVWWTTITNATDGNGPRALLASFVVFDSAFNPTNCLVNALMSP